MHAILATLGTDGDLIPFSGLGMRLRERGHRATLVTAEPYGPLAAGLGLGFRALICDAEFRAPLADPDFWHPIKGPAISARWVTPYILRQHALLDELAANADAVLVASPGVAAARLVQERRGTPLATVVLQAWLIPSISDPPVMPGFPLPRRVPRWTGELYWRLVDVAGGWLVGRHLNRARAALGLDPVRRLFRWWHSPDLILGMFPGWYGLPQADWPPQVGLAGFPLCDGRTGGEPPPEVVRFCRDGDPPVAFTFGTGMMHAQALFREALEVCRRLGVRGLLVTRYRHHLPAQLPPSVLACDFAPFLQLFPLCAAVVHHGGMGTVAKALATGTPQFILPMGYDQFDNAARVKALGAGDSLRSGRRSIGRLAETLARVMDEGTRARCREVADRLRGEDAFETAAELVEGLAGRPRRASASIGRSTRPDVGID